MMMAPSEKRIGEGEAGGPRPEGSAAYWRSKLAGARSLDEVSAIVERFLDSWTPAQLRALPDVCKPPRFQGPEDISAYAVTLAHSHCREQDGKSELDAMTAFFATASQRLAQLSAPLVSRSTGFFRR